MVYLLVQKGKLLSPLLFGGQQIERVTIQRAIIAVPLGGDGDIISQSSGGINPAKLKRLIHFWSNAWNT
jgi:hypothetical protein